MPQGFRNVAGTFVLFPQGHAIMAQRLRSVASRNQFSENQIEHDDEDEHEHEKISRFATIRIDTGRVKLCATPFNFRVGKRPG